MWFAFSDCSCTGLIPIANLPVLPGEQNRYEREHQRIKGEKACLMKTKYFSIGLVVLLALLASAWAADVAGKWSAKAQGADITLTFVVDGTKLTGTLDNSQAGPTDIKDGKIEGDQISFHVVRSMGESEIKITWKGTIAGDEIKFKREAQGGMGGPGGGSAEEIIARRVK